MSTMSTLPRTQNKIQREPSRFIFISGLQNPRSLTELRHWFTRGHHIYDELRKPAMPACVAGHGPERLVTSTSDGHPAWNDTLNAQAITEVDCWLSGQVHDIEHLESALALESEEKKLAAEEEERLDQKERRRKEIKARTWTGSRGKYGNEAGARPHGFHGRAAGAELKLVPQVEMTGSHEQHIYAFPHALPNQFGLVTRDMSQQYHQPTIGSVERSPMRRMLLPLPAPTSYGLDEMVTPAFGLPQPASYAWDGVLHGTEEYVLATPTQMATAPALSVLSPRATDFVPQGIFTPELNVAAPIAGAISTFTPTPPPNRQ
ncbi:hypothetical protein B0J12DRAFT_148365 [Macrophomina phaseolina]|uniref:Uncharacterized protein n=1 Tax=Macrophomina phaseolina TaxID=35725 RepID=A0ABQ8G689_9PEZI|nr:hypothetical protein B0J12DRAFT_148365 [Macrophomina phaseolina]